MDGSLKTRLFSLIRIVSFTILVKLTGNLVHNFGVCLSVLRYSGVIYKNLGFIETNKMGIEICHRIYLEETLHLSVRVFVETTLKGVKVP